MRTLLNTYLTGKASSGSVEDVFYQHEINAVEANQIKVIQGESIEMLKHINIFHVESPEGVSASLSSSSRLASRVDTEKTGRKAREALVHGQKYHCEKTDYDLLAPYRLLDLWATNGTKDFNKKLDALFYNLLGEDMLTIGWYGVEAAKTTNIEKNPMLQDVNIGWLHKIRTQAPERVTDYFQVEKSYSGIECAVNHALGLMDKSHKHDNKNVVILDPDLLSEDLKDKSKSADEKTLQELVLSRILTTGKIAGLPFYKAPSFPAGKILVTKLENLSIYIQGQRRFFRDEPHLDQIAQYFSQAESYVVEDYSHCGLINNLEFSSNN